MNNDPIFTITPVILNLVAEISTKLGEINIVKSIQVNPKLRKENRIKTIHFSITIYLDRKAGQIIRLSFHLVPKLQ